MESRERYIIFGIGVLLGSLILAFSSLGKYRAIQDQKQADILNGYKPSQNIVPGQDLTARKPFDIGPALFARDYPMSEDRTCLRVIIAKGGVGGDDVPLWRIEEILWKDPDSQREKLVKRQIMRADQLVVRLKEGNDNSQELSEKLSALNMCFIGPGRGPRLYNVKLPAYGLDAIPDSINLLISKVEIVEQAFPSYINNF